MHRAAVAPKIRRLTGKEQPPTERRRQGLAVTRFRVRQRKAVESAHKRLRRPVLHMSVQAMIRGNAPAKNTVQFPEGKLDPIHFKLT